jgi:hypothetical protein
LASPFGVIVTRKIPQLNCSNTLILNFVVISLKSHGMLYPFLNMPLIKLILLLFLFAAFNEIVLFCKSRYNLMCTFLYILKRIDNWIIHTSYKWHDNSFSASLISQKFVSTFQWHYAMLHCLLKSYLLVPPTAQHLQLSGCLVHSKKFRSITSDVWHIHRALNVNKKITNYTDCDKFVR